MKNSKILRWVSALSLGAALLASCGEGAISSSAFSSPAAVSSEAASSAVSSVASSMASSNAESSSTDPELTHATSLGTTTAYVGDVLPIASYFSVSPLGASYRIFSSDKNVAKIEGDNIVITGVGDATISLVGAHSAAKMDIYALSQNAKGIKTLIDSIQDSYRFDGTSVTYNGTTEDTGINEEMTQSYYIIKNPKYCYDGYWTWEGNSYYKLAKIKDKQGNYRSYQYVLDDPNSHDVSALSFTRRNYEPEYEEQCFYMDGEVMMPAAKFVDDGEGVTTIDWKTMSDFYCSLGGGYSYTGGWKLPGVYRYQSLTYTKTVDGKGNPALHFELRVIADYRDEDVTLNVITGDFTSLGKATVPLLESYIASGATPCSSDVTPILSSLGAFQDSGNYQIDYRIGYMISETDHSWYKGNYWQTGVYDEDNGKYDYSLLDYSGTVNRTPHAIANINSSAEAVPTTYKYGYYADDEGLCMLSYDEESGKYKKGGVYNDEVHDLESLLYYNAKVFEDERIREIDPLPIGESKYQLDGYLDDGYVSAYIDCLAGSQEIYSYLSYSSWSGSYTTATMEIKDGEIDFFAAVRYDSYIYGAEVRLYGLGAASVDIA